MHKNVHNQTKLLFKLWDPLYLWLPSLHSPRSSPGFLKSPEDLSVQTLLLYYTQCSSSYSVRAVTLAISDFKHSFYLLTYLLTYSLTYSLTHYHELPCGKGKIPPNSSPILTYSRKLSSNLTQPNMCRAYVELLPMVWVLHCEGPHRENDIKANGWVKLLLPITNSNPNPSRNPYSNFRDGGPLPFLHPVLMLDP